MIRRYCTMSGQVFALADDDACPVCEERGHAPVTDQKRCSFFVMVGRTGYPCTEPVGHEGRHQIAHIEAWGRLGGAT